MNMMLDKIGMGNLITFISTYIATEFNWVKFVGEWTNLMFAISATGAAFYSICKIIGWFKKNKKQE